MTLWSVRHRLHSIFATAVASASATCCLASACAGAPPPPIAAHPTPMEREPDAIGTQTSLTSTPHAEKISPHLVHALADLKSNTPIRITASFKPISDPVPHLDHIIATSDPADLSEAESALLSARQLENADLVSALAQDHGAVLLGHCLLIRCLDLLVQAGQVSGLAARDDVLYIDPFETDEPPPQDPCPSPGCIPSDTVRAFMNVGNFRNLNLINVRMLLLDTPVSTSHRLLENNPSVRYIGAFDCDASNTNSCQFTPGTFANDDHGTKAATILVGREKSAPQIDGLTTFTLDAKSMIVPVVRVKQTFIDPGRR